MPRFLNRQQAVLTDSQHYTTKISQEQLSEAETTNTKLDTANTNLVNLKNQQDGIIGAINNTTLGDGTLGQRTYVYAHDVSNGQAKALKCDAAGRLECSVDALEVTAETINLNTDTMEAKLQAISDGQTQNGNGTGNKPGVMLDAINTNTIAGNSKLDTIIINTAAASSAGTATEAKQDTQITHLSEIEGAVEAVELTVGTNTATAPTRSLQIGGKYVDGTFRDIKVDNIGKVIVDSPSGSDINTRIDAIANGQTQDGVGGGNKPGVMLDAINTNTITQNSKIDDTNTKLDSILSKNTQLETLLTTVDADTSALSGVLIPAQNALLTTIDADTSTIAGDTTSIDGKITACNTGAVVVSSSALPSGASTAANQSTANGHLSTIETSLSNVATDNSILSMRVREDSAHVNQQYLMGVGVVRQDTLASLAGTDQDTTMLSVNADGALYNISPTADALLTTIAGDTTSLDGKVTACNTGAIAGSVTANAGTNLNTSALALESGGNLATIAGTVGSNKVNVNIASNAVDFATQTTLAAAEAHLGNIDTGVDVLEACVGSNKVNVNIASNAVDFATQTTLAAAEAHLGNIETAVQLIDDVVKAEDSAHSNTDKGIACLAVRKDTQTQLAGSDADYGMLQTNATGALRVHNNKVYSSETSIVSGQAVSGSGTHTTSAITNDANITEYIVEHDFSGSDVSYEILEGLTNSGLFVNAQGTSYNSAGSPTSALSMINAIEIKSPFFKVKFTNGNASSRDATMSFVAKTTA